MGGELLVPTRSEMSKRSFALKRHLGELSQRPATVNLGLSPGMLEISGSSLDKAKQGPELLPSSLSTIIIKPEKKMPAVSHAVHVRHIR